MAKTNNNDAKPKKSILKRWWFWLIIIIIFGSGIGAIGNSNQDVNKPEDNPTNAVSSVPPQDSSLPILDPKKYERKEGLLVYNELKKKGYTVDAEFKKEILTKMNGPASDLFEKTDENKKSDRESVDNFVVGNLIQDADFIKLIIVMANAKD
ncbi:MAG: hypothetical protein LBB10_02275 [Bifidobacteriaceae bacterium]|jgi:hypothetical protein|nr:hypothetical protein [Bifidobacteriaceae bacterium]